jgi:hypothetical protein
LKIENVDAPEVDWEKPQKEILRIVAETRRICTICAPFTGYAGFDPNHSIQDS